MNESVKTQAIEKIAKETLRLETLECRRNDALDFHDLSVWTIRRALERAYDEGAKSQTHT